MKSAFIQPRVHIFTMYENIPELKETREMY